MRPIKFRAWDVELKEWRHDFQILPDGVVYAMDSTLTEYIEMEQPSELVLTQFTGLTDKNGKEIWEGDIVQVGTEQRRAEVVFGRYQGNCQQHMEYGFHLLDGNDVWGMMDCFGEPEQVDVIGDIYENPELIKNG